MGAARCIHTATCRSCDIIPHLWETTTNFFPCTYREPAEEVRARACRHRRKDNYPAWLARRTPHNFFSLPSTRARRSLAFCLYTTAARINIYARPRASIIYRSAQLCVFFFRVFALSLSFSLGWVFSLSSALPFTLIMCLVSIDSAAIFRSIAVGVKSMNLDTHVCDVAFIDRFFSIGVDSSFSKICVSVNLRRSGESE